MAYDVIKNEHPRTLGLLELSRVAATMGYSLGHCFPYATSENGINCTLKYYIDFRDGDNPDFLEALGSFGGAINANDLNSAKDLASMDLREISYSFKINREFGFPYLTPLITE